MAASEYQIGGGWSPEQKKFGGAPGYDLPWDQSFGEQVFHGEVTFTTGGFYQLAVLKGSLDAPEAVAEFQEAGRTVKVEFLDEQGRPVLRFLFVDGSFDPDGKFFGDSELLGPGQLFLRDVSKITWTGEYGTAGVEKRKVLTRQHSNFGATRVIPLVFETDERPSESEWHSDPEVDVSGDGFWEPVAAFGDWDRWFVRDRPGVKLVD